MVTVVAVLMLVVVAGVLVVAIHKQRLTRSGTSWDSSSDVESGDADDWPDWPDWPAAGVREPRRPPPTGGAAEALARPEEDAA